MALRDEYITGGADLSRRRRPLRSASVRAAVCTPRAMPHDLVYAGAQTTLGFPGRLCHLTACDRAFSAHRGRLACNAARRRSASPKENR